MRTFVLSLAAAGLMTVGADALSAQGSTASPTNRRFWAAIGVSGGEAALTCGFCTGRTQTSFAGMLAFGTTYRRRSLIGIEAQGWRYANDGVTRRVYAAMPIAQFYPIAKTTLFFKTGLGLAQFVSSDGEAALEATAVSGMLGGGFEVRLTPNYVLVPYLSYLGGAGGTMRLDDERVTRSAGVSLFQYGVSIALR
jgi:hypothetical protein